MTVTDRQVATAEDGTPASADTPDADLWHPVVSEIQVSCGGWDRGS